MEMTIEIKMILMLAVLMAVVVVETYLLLKHQAKKYCKFHDLQFDKFWNDEMAGKIDRTNPYWMDSYKIAPVVMVLFSAFMMSCTTTKYVEVPVVHTDTLIVTNHQKDSVWLHDSIYMHEWQKGDTVVVDRVVYHTKYKEKLRTDTVYQHSTDTIAKPYPVEVKVEKELTWWQKKTMGLGYVFFGICVVVVIILIVKFISKFR